MSGREFITVWIGMIVLAFVSLIGLQGCICNDADGDGYGDPGSIMCPNARLDCDDDDPSRNPGEAEGPFGDTSCSDGFDNDCNLLVDSDDPTCDEDDLNMTPEDFACILGWEQVPEDPPGVTYYFTNLKGYLPEAIDVASSPTGGTFPPGTIIQILPSEAMVKRAPGWSPSTGDWEFFRLGVSETGTVIVQRGINTRNPIHPGPCIQCHQQADPQWDFVCGDGGDHGCDPLPAFITDALILNLQQSDPRCP